MNTQDGIMDKPAMTVGNIVLDDSEVPGNNNNTKEVSGDELELLRKLEEANRMIESDCKSLNSLNIVQQQQPGSSSSQHSRQASISSQLSGDTVESSTDNEEDLWTTWGKIINEWDSSGKKKLPRVRELSRQGIPHHFRGMAWQVLCDAHNSQERCRK